MKMTYPTILSTLIACTAASADLEIREASDTAKEGYQKIGYKVEEHEMVVFVNETSVITSKDIETVSVRASGTAGEKAYELSIVFTDSGADKMKQLTEKNIKKQIAFIVDGELLTTPTVQNVITKQISMTGYSKAEAEELAAKIKKS